jgi:hypothetical protein
VLANTHIILTANSLHNCVLENFDCYESSPKISCTKQGHISLVDCQIKNMFSHIIKLCQIYCFNFLLYFDNVIGQVTL